MRRIIKTGENKYELSEYIPGEASPEVIIWTLKKLKGCFPDTTKEVFETLVEMLKAEQWSDIRIRDAVREAILTHKFPRITPANILDFDKRIRLYTFSQVQEEAYKRNGHHFECFKGFEKIELNGWEMYFKENDHRFAVNQSPAPSTERKYELYPEKVANRRAYEAFG